MITEIALLFSTATIALLSAGASLIVGIPVGLFLLSLPRKVRAAISAVVAVPFLLPAFLIGVSLLPLVPNDSDPLPWIVLAHAFMNAGFIALVTAAAISGIPKEHVEQAVLEGAGGFKILRLIQLPQSRGPLAGAALLVALYSATSFGLVLSLGSGRVETLETEIAQAVLYRLDFSSGAVLGALQTVLTIALMISASRFAGPGFANLFGSQGARVKFGLLSSVIGISYVLAISGFFFQIISRADFPNGFALLGTRGERDLLNLTVLEAAGNSARNMLLAVVISFALAWILASSRLRLFGWLILIPVGISPVVIGLVFLLISGMVPGIAGISWLLVPLAQVFILTPLIYQLLEPAIRSLSSEISDASKLDGASSLQRSVLITFPVLRRPILVAISFGALASLGEFGASSFLTFGSDSTLSVVMFQLASRPGGTNLAMAMSIALIYLLLSGLVVFLISLARTED